MKKPLIVRGKLEEDKNKNNSQNTFENFTTILMECWMKLKYEFNYFVKWNFSPIFDMVFETVYCSYCRFSEKIKKLGKQWW